MNDALHCLSCGARLVETATQCGACHSPVAKVPQAPIANGVRCPRCKARNVASGVLARLAIDADCTYLECATCFGHFVEPHEWSAMLEAVIANDSRVKHVKEIADERHGELSRADTFQLLQCPGCNRELDRLVFSGRSNVSIDVCTIHGAWFDPGELAKVLEVVRYKNEHAGALPSDDNSALSAEQRREKVLNSMGISDPEYDKHRGPALKVKDGFSANRLAGRVALVAGGVEGAAAFEVLKAVAHGSGAAFGWAIKSASGEGPIGDVPANISSSRYAPLPSLRCLFCGASHPESATECGQCRTPIARVTCPACRSLIAAGEQKCRCGAPLMPHATREQMACPRCKSALDRIPLDASTVAHRCPRCLGSFFDIQDWTTVIDGAVSGRPLPLENFAPLPDRAQPAPFLDAGAACSRCRRAMERIAFAGRSRVTVDVCPSHGMWLDAGELNALCSFMKGSR